MRARVPLAVAVFAAALLAQPATADPVGGHIQITPFAGYTVFDGELRLNGHSLKDDLYFGGRLGYQFNPLWGLELAGGFTPTAEDAPGSPDADFFHYSGNVMVSPWPGLVGSPFLFLGAGSAQAKPTSGEDESKGSIEFGGGLRAWLTDAIGLRLEVRQIYYSIDYPDGEHRISHLVAGGGLVLALGGKGRDTDADGVPDRRDSCANTPKGARVDSKGCPLDSDSDGVFDGIDQCTTTIKGCTVDARGCESDADGDGVCDGLDQCADTPDSATVDAKGCPSDTDGDRVFDGIDKCPGTPTGATVDAQGCPKDADADGVFDGIDKCPETGLGLKVDSLGCPIEFIEKETELLDTGMIRLQNVNFQTAKADVLPETYAVLDVVGQVLRKWPELKIEIGGHTDSRGADKYNQRLSESRATEVMKYLTTKFADLWPGQYTAKGYGESRPLVPNTSDLNMSKNRRVEFVVQNRDVLRREVQRRRLLQKGEALPDTTKAPAPAPAPADTTRR